MATARWNGVTIAQSDQTIIVEGNHYFPPDSVNMTYLQETASQTSCFWKGEANYYNIVVGGKMNKDAAWVYREPLEKANQIKSYVAFWRGVELVD